MDPLDGSGPGVQKDLVMETQRKLTKVITLLQKTYHREWVRTSEDTIVAASYADLSLKVTPKGSGWEYLASYGRTVGHPKPDPIAAFTDLARAFERDAKYKTEMLQSILCPRKTTRS